MERNRGKRRPVGSEYADSRRLLTAEALAERWQVPVSQVYRQTREGKVPVVKVGRYYRYSLVAIEQYERAGVNATPSDPSPPPPVDELDF